MPNRIFNCNWPAEDVAALDVEVEKWKATNPTPPIGGRAVLGRAAYLIDLFRRSRAAPTPRPEYYQAKGIWVTRQEMEAWVAEGGAPEGSETEFYSWLNVFRLKAQAQSSTEGTVPAACEAPGPQPPEPPEPPEPESPAFIANRFLVLAERLRPLDDVAPCEEAAGALLNAAIVILGEPHDSMTVAEASRFLDVLERSLLIALRKWTAEDPAAEDLRDLHLAAVQMEVGQTDAIGNDLESWQAMNTACASNTGLAEIAGDAFVRVLRDELGLPVLELRDA